MKHKTKKLVALVPAFTGSMMLLSPAIHGQALPQGTAQSVALTGAEQDQRTRQQQEARERAQSVQAPAVRAAEVVPVDFRPLPTETPCFRIDRFSLNVPPDLSAEVRAQGASTLPQDPFAFARTWLDHYAGL